MTYDEVLTAMLGSRLAAQKPALEATSEPGRPIWKPSTPPTEREALAFFFGQFSEFSHRTVLALRSEACIPDLGGASLALGAGALSVLEALPRRTVETSSPLEGPEALRDATRGKGIVGLADADAPDEVVNQRLEALTRTLSDIAGELVNEPDSVRLPPWLLDVVKEAAQLAVWASS